MAKSGTGRLINYYLTGMIAIEEYLGFLWGGGVKDRESGGGGG